MTTHAQDPKQARNRRQVPAIVVGTLLALIALGTLVAGGLGVAAHATQRDDDGYYRTAAAQLSTPTHVLVADDIGVGEDSKWLFHTGRLGTVRVSATGTADDAIFVGVARQSDVRSYLRGVGRDDLEDVDVRPFTISTERRPGARTPAAPLDQTFWTDTASGAGRQTVDWPVQRGKWAVVVMNADASAGVHTSLRVAAKSSFVLWAGLGLLAGGGLAAVGAAALIALGVRGRPPYAAPPAPSADAAPAVAS